MKQGVVWASAIALIGLGGVAHAKTYVGTRMFAGATVNLRVTTDGFTGLLSNPSDITSWNVNISDDSGSTDLTPQNSQVFVVGYDIQITPKHIYFFANPQLGGALGFFADGYSTDLPFYCASAGNFCLSPFDGNESARATVDGSMDTQLEYGRQTLAVAVPETSTWSMLLLGLAGVGGAFRRRSQRKIQAG